MNNCIHQKANSDDGYIVVETVGAFVPFLLLVISILSLVNIITVQAQVHYALTQTANTLSMYCYTLEVLGVANELTALDNKANRFASEAEAFRNDVGAVLDGINSASGLGGVLGSAGDATGRAFSWAEDAAGDPKAALQLIMNFGLNELRDQVAEPLIRPLVGRYLASGGMTGDEYLRKAGVVNTISAPGKKGIDALVFSQLRYSGGHSTTLIDRDGNVRLVVEYEIEYTFGGLPLPFGPTISITQEVITKAWLNGSGPGYR